MRIVATLLVAMSLAFAVPSSAETAFGAVNRDSGVITLGGVPHVYMIEGKGDDAPCLFVGPGTQYAQMLSDELKQSMRFVFVDFKRTWTAPPGLNLNGITLQRLVDEIDEFRVAMNFDQVCLIGHSTPAFVAVEYAIQHPERVSRLILIGMPAYYNADAVRIQKDFWEDDASPERKARYAENLQKMPNSVLETLTPYEDFMMRYTRSHPYYFYDFNYDITWANIGHYFSTELAIHFYRVTMADYDPRGRLAENKVPIFATVGRYNYLMPPELWDGFVDRVPNTTLVMFERSGHFPMIEERERFEKELLQWMKQTSRRGTSPV